MNNLLKPILLVEDSPNDLELTLVAFGRARLANEVVALRDGAEALDYLFRRGTYADRAPQNPAVVLLDLSLPKIDGLQVVKAMKAEEATRNIPIVVFTSSGEQKDLVHSYSLGVNAYVVKPVGFPEFLEAIRDLGIFWAVLNETSAAGAQSCL